MPVLREIISDSGTISLATDSIYQNYIWHYSENSGKKQDFMAVDTSDTHEYYDLMEGNYFVTVVDSAGCEADSEILNITVSSTDPVKFYGINIFPNPATDYLSILTEKVLNKVKIEIYNNKGRLIKQLKSSLPGTIPLQNIPSGINILKVTAGQKYFVTKVMKK